MLFGVTIMTYPKITDLKPILPALVGVVDKFPLGKTFCAGNQFGPCNNLNASDHGAISKLNFDS